MKFWDKLKYFSTSILIFFLIIVLTLVFYTVDFNFPTQKRKSIDSDTALSYLYELENYIEESGDTDICRYFIEYMDENSIEVYSDRLKESYDYGYQIAYEELTHGED